MARVKVVGSVGVARAVVDGAAERGVNLRLVDAEGNELGTAELIYTNNRDGAVLNNVNLR